MVKCPSCNQETRQDLEKCQYCNAVLPKGFFNKFFKAISKVSEQIKEDAEFKRILEKMGKGLEITSTEGSFRMIGEDVFFIEGRGTVVVGKIQSGIIKINNTVFVVSKNGQRISCKVKGIEMFRKLLQEAKTGDSVGLLLSKE